MTISQRWTIGNIFRLITARGWLEGVHFLSNAERPIDSLEERRAARALRADMEAFEEFVHRYERQILNYLWRMTNDEQAAYDLRQETFLRAWQHFTKIRDYERPRAWLFHVATNLALSHHRQHKRNVPSATMSDELDSEIQTPSDPIDSFVESDLVHHVLQAMQPRRRAALILRVIYGLSAEEIGQALGMTDNATRMTLSRGREQFRQIYAKEAQS